LFDLAVDPLALWEQRKRPVNRTCFCLRMFGRLPSGGSHGHSTTRSTALASAPA
jgi:hypothetical protein